MSNNVRTWADGYGRWHVEMPKSLGIQDAIAEISYQIWLRSGKSSIKPVREYVEQNMVNIPSDKPGRVHFAEYAID